jgi:histidyl-tRNA synthetase (EC 6.1.1.21)
MVVDRQQALTKPIKWVSTRPFWRYEQVQQGRFREFYQTNIDVFGSSEPAADAEVLAVAADALTDLGLTAADFEFRVSHRDLLDGLLEAFDGTVDTAAAIRAIDKRAKIAPDEYAALLRAAGLADRQVSQLDELLATPADRLEELTAFADVDDAVGNLTAVLEAAAERGIREYCTLSLTTARGLDYYTGVVFECFDSTGEVGRSVFGGGRYDDLIESYGGQPTPAVGVAPGHATLALLCQRAGVWPDERLTTDYYVLQVGETGETAATVARQLRNRGHVVETDVSGRSFGAQLEYADSINAETVVIVGERDLAEGKLTLKQMASGEQQQVPVEAFPGDHSRPTVADFV